MNIPDDSNDAKAEALLTICLHAAFADGEKSESEREQIQKLAAELGLEEASSLGRQVLLGRRPIGAAVAALPASTDRMLAYEMALAVCEAGGIPSDMEKVFLQGLRADLQLTESESRTVETEVDEVAMVPDVPAATPPAIPAGPDNNGMILKYSILNGALELLPETLATMAIIPFQIKMVYRIGTSHGVELDRRHITEFLATAGLGLGSQMVEGFARQLFGKLGKRFGGKMAGKVASQAAGSATSFASTYAIGKLADVYYSGGRRLDTAQIRSSFDRLKGEAAQLHARYLPEIQQRAQTLNPTEILQLVRGQGPA
ncbi:MAG: DUF533 domain-containing protein [Terrimicrobiaceae bacterium]|nr:DUF533 domain-containing protein [Terrimicrobiaceae bacterium]